MRLSKNKKNFKKRFISKKKQIGHGNLSENRHVPILAFPENLIDKIMKEVVCTCDLKLSANYDKRSFQFYDPKRELTFEYPDKNMPITKIIINDKNDYFTDDEISTLQKCIYLAVAKYRESDDSSIQSESEYDESELFDIYEKTFNNMDIVKINLKLCNYNNFNKNITDEVGTVLYTYKENNREWCILRFHIADIGAENPRFGPNTAEIPIECLEKYNGQTHIQAVVNDHAIIDLNLKYCDNINPNYNNALGKILHIYKENNMLMCIFKFEDSELGADNPTFGPNTAEIPINCLDIVIKPNHSFKSMKTPVADMSDEEYEDEEEDEDNEDE